MTTTPANPPAGCAEPTPSGSWSGLGWPWNRLAALGLVLTGAVTVIGLGAWADAFATWIPALGRSGQPTGLFVVLGLGLVGTALFLGALAFGEALLATLVTTVAVLPSAAAIGMLLVYMVAKQDSVLQGDALYLGAVSALVLWALSAPLFTWLAAADTAQPRSYGELVQRTRRLSARLAAIAAAAGPSTDPVVADRRASLDEARAYLAILERELGFCGPPGRGFRYAFATGYVNLWRAVHRIEELLIVLGPESRATAEAWYDGLRLDGMRNQATIKAALSRALAPFGPSAGPAGGSGGAVGDGPNTETAREVLVAIRRAINIFRDDGWEGFIRERNRLLRTILVTSSVTLLFVALAVAFKASKETLAAASAFYLVGSVVGLFARLRIESAAGSALDDYGRYEARLLGTPLLSGLAAIAGVFIVGLTPALLGVDTTTNDPTSSIDLGAVFSITSNARGLIAAAIFGLAPELLVKWLRSKSDDISDQLSKTQAAGNSAGQETPDSSSGSGSGNIQTGGDPNPTS